MSRIPSWQSAYTQGQLNCDIEPNDNMCFMCNVMLQV